MWRKLDRNLEIKLLSLFLAVVFWLFVVGEQQGELDLTAPVEVRNIASGLAVEKLEHDQIELRVVGPRIVMLRLNMQKVTVPLDASRLREGKAVFSGLDRSVPLPYGLQISRVYPSSVEVTLGKKAPSVEK